MSKAAPRQTVHRARIPADAMAVVVVQVLALLGVWACAIIVSFTGLVAAAGWANVSGSQRYAVPLFIDGILVGASLAYLVARERKDTAARAIALVAMLVFCGLSIVGNAVHALGSGAVGVQRATGVALAVAAPIAILVTTELLARTVIASPDEHVPAPSRSVRRAARIIPLQPGLSAPTAAPVTSSPANPTARVVGPVRPAPTTARPDREAQRATFLEHLASGLSVRAAGAAAGIPASTAQRWAAEARSSGISASGDQDVLISA